MWVEAPNIEGGQNQDKYKNRGCKIQTNNMGVIAQSIDESWAQCIGEKEKIQTKCVDRREKIQTIPNIGLFEHPLL